MDLQVVMKPTNLLTFKMTEFFLFVNDSIMFLAIWQQTTLCPLIWTHVCTWCVQTL